LIFVVVVVRGLLWCRFEVVVVDDFCVSSTSFFDIAADLCVVVVVASQSSFPIVTSVFPDDQKTTAALRPKHQGTCRPLENAFDESIIIIIESVVVSFLSRKKKKTTKSARCFYSYYFGEKNGAKFPFFFSSSF
jgi:hypothetical protein